MPGTRTLAETYARLAADVADASPLSGAVALALSRSGPALEVLAGWPARGRNPRPVLAALHDLALSGGAPTLAAAYAEGDPDAAGAAAVEVLPGSADVLRAAAGRRLRPEEVGHPGVLLPAVAEAARRAGALAVGLVSVGCGAGFDLALDRSYVTYGDGTGLGDPSSPVRTTCGLPQGGHVPDRAVPEVVARVGIDPDPSDVTDPVDARWLRACLAPDDRPRRSRLDAEVGLLAELRPTLLHGDVLDRLPDALALVPAAALPVVLTTWSLSALAPTDRLRFLQALDAAATRRTVAWVSVEGVGVAPGVPTFGDRPASGHSIVGITLLAHASLRSEAVGRCWSRGRLLAWLAQDTS